MSNLSNEGVVSAETPTDVEKLRKLPWSIGYEAANTVFVQFVYWGTPFVLFLNELDFSNSQVGLIYSLFPYFGLIALFIAPTIARVGYKRTYLTFYSLRYAVTLFLLLIPWLHLRYDGRYTWPALISVVATFALCRAVAETAIYPWIQEYIPNRVRGRYSATSNVVTRIVGVVAVSVAGYLVDRSTDLNRFIIVIGLGVAFGFLSVVLVAQLPGGGPTVAAGSPRGGIRQTLSALGDPNFRIYLLGLGAITIVNSPLSAFVPLFMKREVGLMESQVVLLQTGVLIGGLFSTFFWGWAADRYGSKPVIMSGLMLSMLLSLGWLLMPRGDAAFYTALALASLQGIATMGWLIAGGRLLYVNIVPPQQKANYMAVYYAVLGLFGGTAQLLNGTIVDAAAGLQSQFSYFIINPYTPLFINSLVLAAVGILLFRRIDAQNDYSIGEFVGLFMRGNPFSAMTAMARYYRASDEQSSLVVTEKLGRTGSLLAVDELLDALQDPRFNVRYEAVNSLARLPANPRITNALHDIVTGTELALTAPAILALGKIGSADSAEILRQTLDSDYLSIRAHGAHALGAVGDTLVADDLLQRLQSEENPGLNMAYASALGNMGWEAAAPAIMALLDSAENRGARLELALSLARIIGNEGNFIQLLRKERADMGTSSAQALIALRKRYAKDATLTTHLDDCINSFAAQSLDAGAHKLGAFIKQLPAEKLSDILIFCGERLSAEGVAHPELVVLAVHALANS